MVGNIPNFTRLDILRCFLRFEKNTGRQELAKELELGEGTIRTILEILKEKGLLDSTKKGHFLNKKGEEQLEKMHLQISSTKIVESNVLYANYKKVAVLVKDPIAMKEICRIRDIAVKSGADGAIILIYNGRLQTPQVDYEVNYSELENLFDFRNNDVLVVSFASKTRNAESGALAIAVELNDTLKKFINEF